MDLPDFMLHHLLELVPLKTKAALALTCKRFTLAARACMHDVAVAESELREDMFKDFSVQRLHLKECYTLSDDDVAAFFEVNEALQPTMQQFRIDNCQSVTLQGLNSVSFGPKLHLIQLHACDSLFLSTPTSPFASLRHVSTLEIAACNSLNDGSAACLSQLTQLHRLSLPSCTHIVLLQFVPSLTNLTSLNLFGCPKVCDESMIFVSQCPSITALNVAYTRVTDHALSTIALLPHLTDLNLKGCNVSEDGLPYLHEASCLTALNIKHCHRVTLDGMTAVASSCPHLLSFGYGYQNFPEANDVMHVLCSHFPSLHYLNFTSMCLTDIGFEAVTRLQRLACLRLWQASMTTAGLQQLQQLPCLTNLTIYGDANLGDAGLEVIAGLRKLEKLHLGDVPVTTDGLRQLSHLHSLQRLFFEAVPAVTESWLSELVCSLRNLRKVSVRGCVQMRQINCDNINTNFRGNVAYVKWIENVDRSLDTDDDE